MIKIMRDSTNRLLVYLIVFALILASITVKYVKKNLVETYYGKQVDLRLRAK